MNSIGSSNILMSRLGSRQDIPFSSPNDALSNNLNNYVQKNLQRLKKIVIHLVIFRYNKVKNYKINKKILIRKIKNYFNNLVLKQIQVSI